MEGSLEQSPSSAKQLGVREWRLEEMDLSHVECRYVFTGFDYSTKSPSDRYPATGDLPPAGLERKNTENRLTIPVSFLEAPNWEALVFTLTQVELESPNLQLTLQSYEVKSGKYVLRLSANRLVNTKLISQRIVQVYPEMLQRFLTRRQLLLDLLEIKEAQNLQIERLPPLPAPPPPSLSPTHRKRQLYQEVVTQIQRIILSQAPEQCVESVERLIEFLQQQNISTEEIQKQVIGKVIMKRAEADGIFQKHLLRWEETASEAARFSVVGQAVRLAIAMIVSNNALL